MAQAPAELTAETLRTWCDFTQTANRKPQTQSNAEISKTKKTPTERYFACGSCQEPQKSIQTRNSYLYGSGTSNIENVTYPKNDSIATKPKTSQPQGSLTSGCSGRPVLLRSYRQRQSSPASLAAILVLPLARRSVQRVSLKLTRPQLNRNPVRLTFVPCIASSGPDKFGIFGIRRLKSEARQLSHLWEKP
jgi:hypothetical protein